MNLVFYISAAVAIVATFLVITRTNAVHAILYLVVWLLAVFCAGTGFLLYVILWIALPLAPATNAITSAPGTPARV